MAIASNGFVRPSMRSEAGRDGTEVPSACLIMRAHA
jgi:hypothetical protein